MLAGLSRSVYKNLFQSNVTVFPIVLTLAYFGMRALCQLTVPRLCSQSLNSDSCPCSQESRKEFGRTSIRSGNHTTKRSGLFAVVLHNLDERCLQHNHFACCVLSGAGPLSSNKELSTRQELQQKRRRSEV